MCHASTYYSHVIIYLHFFYIFAKIITYQLSKKNVNISSQWVDYIHPSLKSPITFPSPCIVWLRYQIQKKRGGGGFCFIFFLIIE